MNSNQTKHLQTGETGESLGKDFLEEQGFQIIDSNVFNKYGEIDVVAIKSRKLHFVEIRTRLSESYGDALSSISEEKQTRMYRAAQAYRYDHQEFRQYIPVFSIITIDSDETDHMNIKLYEDIIMEG